MKVGPTKRSVGIAKGGWVDIILEVPLGVPVRCRDSPVNKATHGACVWRALLPFVRMNRFAKRRLSVSVGAPLQMANLYW